MPLLPRGWGVQRRWCTAGGRGGGGSKLAAMGLRSPLDIDREDLQRERARRDAAAQRAAEAERLQMLQAAAAQRGMPFPEGDAAADDDENRPMTREEQEALEEAQIVAAMNRSVGLTLLAFIVNFTLAMAGATGLLFTLVDMKAPIPPFEMGARRRVNRDPQSITMSWMPMMLVPSIVAGISLAPRMRSIIIAYMRQFKRDVARLNAAAPLKATAARDEHISGVNRIVRKDRDGGWGEKGADWGVLLNTRNIRRPGE